MDVEMDKSDEEKDGDRDKDGEEEEEEKEDKDKNGKDNRDGDDEDRMDDKPTATSCYDSSIFTFYICSLPQHSLSRHMLYSFPLPQRSLMHFPEHSLVHIFSYTQP